MNLFDRTITQNHKYAFAIILIVALGARILTAYYTWVIGADSIHYLEMADLMRPIHLEILAGIDHHVFHPLYPILMATVRDIAQIELVTAGKTISVIFGFLCIIPLFIIARHLFGTIPALCAASLFAVHPDSLEMASDIMSEATFVFFVLSCIAFAIPVVTHRSLACSLMAGVSTGMAYLARPEGGTPLLVLIIVLLATMRKDLNRSAKLLALCLLGFAFVALPYLMHISFIDGTFKPEITLKKPVWEHEPQDDITKPVPVAASTRSSGQERSKHNVALYLPNKYVGSIFYFNLPFVIIGISLSVIHRRKLGLSSYYIVWVIVATILLGYCLSSIRANYLSHRHIITVTILSIAWAGYGLAHSALWIRSKICLQERYSTLAVFLLSTIVVAVHFPKIMRPPHWTMIGTKSVGKVIARENLGTDEYVITNLNHVLRYANLKYRNKIRIINSSQLTYKEIMRIATETGGRARFVVVQYKRDFRHFIDSGEYDNLVLIYKFGQEELYKEYGITRKLIDKRKLYLYKIPLKER